MEATTTSTARSRAFFCTRIRGAGNARWGGFWLPYASGSALFLCSLARTTPAS